MKKLKLRIAKFDRMLVVEQLGRSGEFENTEHISLKEEGGVYLDENGICICKSSNNRMSSIELFSDNQERDEYAANLIRWITEEQFGGSRKLEIGKPCLVRDYEDAGWEENIYAGKLSHNIRDRDALFLTESDMSRTHFVSWKYAKPLNSAQPKIDGEIHTWEVDE